MNTLDSPVPTVRLKDCPNCDCHLASVWCDGCEMTLCVFCYDEHENGAPCHVADCDEHLYEDEEENDG